MGDDIDFAAIRRARFKAYLSRSSAGHDYSGRIEPSSQLGQHRDSFMARVRGFFVDADPRSVSLSVSCEDDHRWICQRMILALTELRGGEVHWDSVTAYGLVEEWLGENSPVVRNYSEPELLFIIQGRGEVPNKMLFPVANALVASREMAGRFTVCISYKGGQELEPAPVSVLSWIGAARLQDGAGSPKRDLV